MPTLSRRQLILSASAGIMVPLAGCLGEDAEVDTDPIDLGGGFSCVVCGMEIGAHYGPAVQAFYENGSGDGERPVAFDSLYEFINYDNEQELRRNDRLAAYATDYSVVDFDLEVHEDEVFISTHVASGAFAPVADLLYVVDSDLRGAMGPDAMPFSERDLAESITADHGGRVVEWTELTS